MRILVKSNSGKKSPITTLAFTKNNSTVPRAKHHMETLGKHLNTIKSQRKKPIRTSEFTKNNPIVLLEKLNMETFKKSTKSKNIKSRNATDLTKRNPIVLLEKLDADTLGKYLNRDKRKADQNLVDALQGLSLTSKKQISHFERNSKQCDVKKNPDIGDKRKDLIFGATLAADFQCTDVLPNPCKKGCEHICEYISDEWRHQFNRNFWCLNSEDERKSFFDGTIKYSWKEDCVNCHYFVNIKGIEQKVCLKFLLATLNIKIDSIVEHISKVLRVGKNQ